MGANDLGINVGSYSLKNVSYQKHKQQTKFIHDDFLSDKYRILIITRNRIQEKILLLHY